MLSGDPSFAACCQAKHVEAVAEIQPTAIPPQLQCYFVVQLFHSHMSEPAELKQKQPSGSW